MIKEGSSLESSKDTDLPIFTLFPKLIIILEKKEFESFHVFVGACEKVNVEVRERFQVGHGERL